MYSTYNYILNPKTGLYVKKDSPKGQELVKKFPEHYNLMEIDLEKTQIEKEQNKN